MELISSQIGVRLAATVEKSMSDYVFEDNIYLIAEVRAATKEDRWMWVPTEHNIADLGTRTVAKLEDLEVAMSAGKMLAD
ncbi:MAG: hypothetical protein GY696_33230 [Gammaproteobacteria bacterium]|nr:hypothetical protein [Gammaproteobacteria bacterium]